MDLETEIEHDGGEQGFGYGYGEGDGNGPTAWEPAELFGQGPTSGKFKVELRGLALHAEYAHGIHSIAVTMDVCNLHDTPVAEGALSILINAEPYNAATGDEDDNAERAASYQASVPALTPRGSTLIHVPLQVDPSHWHVTVFVWALADGLTLARADGDVLIQGHHATEATFDLSTKLDLRLAVTHLTHVDESFYRVHFVLHNRAYYAVPAGLPLLGSLSSDPPGGIFTQTYELPEPIAAGASHESYLTLEGAQAGRMWATIQVNLPYTIEPQDTLEVRAEDVRAVSHGHAVSAHGR
jgi:hypothetical protein